MGESGEGFDSQFGRIVLDDFSLLEELCSIPGISGDEQKVKNYLLQFIESHSSTWLSKPQVIVGPEIQDAILLVFGKPRTVLMAHIDTVGFTAGYGADLIKVGGPAPNQRTTLVDSKGEKSKIQIAKNGHCAYLSKREYTRGTPLSYAPNFKIDQSFIQSPYLDNRLGVYVALQVAKTLENGIIAFSTYEETGGGNAEVLARYIYENYKIHQALICDITWVTSGVQHGNGVAISTRDSGIPRRAYLDKILAAAEKSGIPFQLEVESSGGSDGNALQRSPYPYDWCFVGAPEDHVHSPNEKVAIKDVCSMIEMHRVLMANL